MPDFSSLLHLLPPLFPLTWEGGAFYGCATTALIFGIVLIINIKRERSARRESFNFTAREKSHLK
jgi:hypothetical protein